MNIPLRFKCPTCGAPRTQKVHLNDPSADFTCGKCGNTWCGIAGLDVTVGVLILARSCHELEFENDYDMAIVLAATALDCELSSLYYKWTRIEAVGAVTAIMPEDSERELRSMGSVTEKITKISAMLYEGGVEKFVVDSGSWKETLKQFPSLHADSLPKDFQQTVFWPRNKVLHRGEVNHTREDAAKCYSIAQLGIHILKEMDNAKRRSQGL